MCTYCILSSFFHKTCFHSKPSTQACRVRHVLLQWCSRNIVSVAVIRDDVAACFAFNSSRKIKGCRRVSRSVEGKRCCCVCIAIRVLL
jgi:hypothetical protein